MTVKDILKAKKNKKKITMLTAYDFPLALLADAAGVDVVLVGDSLANVVLGLDSTKDVGIEEMLHHAKAVRRAVKNALVVGDMPFSAYQKNSANAVKNAKRFLVEAGCEAVKLEWFEGCVNVVEKLVKAKIPVIGHVGLTPQTADKLGGMKVQGKIAHEAFAILNNAIALQKAGCFCIVLECIPTELAKTITEKLSIPTVGIGAGKFCDGQVLVSYDLLGIQTKYLPKFVKQYAQLSGKIEKAFRQYVGDVKTGKFPDKGRDYPMDALEKQLLDGLVESRR